MTRDWRDLDGVIDDVAQAMTGEELSRDLRPAIAARIASRAGWMPGWRVATATAALAVAVVAVVVVLRPGEPPPQTRPVAEAVTRPSVDAPAVAPVQASEPRPARSIARTARQTIAPATPGIVDIDPVAIVPLKEDGAASDAPASAQVVVIPLKDVEPVRINQLGVGE
jgi:hypothetical protein